VFQTSLHCTISFLNFSYRLRNARISPETWKKYSLMHHCTRIQRKVCQSVRVRGWNGSTKMSWNGVTDGSWTRRTRKDTENIIVLGDALRKSIFWSIIIACNGARSTAVSSLSSLTLPAPFRPQPTANIYGLAAETPGIG